ncbi:MAG: iron ABC transporter permease [Lachnospiraceae bacterium]|nr:iron ABC transporter permease [Lachnospiraceae bacterium]
MKKRAALFVTITGIMAVIGLITAVSCGAKSIPLKTIWDSLFHFEETLDMQLVRDLRLPRAICTALIGGFLGITGAMMQGVTRNPIAEPSIMGVSQGATLAVAIMGMSPSLYGVLGNTVAALIGASVSGFLVLLFSIQNARNMNISRLLLAGTALSTFFISLASVIAILSNKSQNLAYWVSGGFRTATWKSVWLLLIVGGICTLLALMLSSRINIVNLGEDVAIGLGENPVRVRVYTLLLIIPLCAISVSVAGCIGFVGLIIPHVVRRIVGVDYRYIMPVSFLAGGCLLIWADVAARLVNEPYETPIGLFTALIGIPFFIHLVRKERG